MGNHRFRISDMMPNAWFFKLKDMGKPRNHTKKQPQSTSTPQQPKPKQTHFSHPRKSYYISRDLTPTDRFYNSPTNPKNFPETPRKSSKQRPSRKSTRSSGPKLVNVTSSVSAGCSCRASIDSVWKNAESPPEFSSFSPTDSSPEPELCETPPPEFRSDQALDEMVSCLSSCKCRLEDNKHFANKFDKVDGFHTIPGLELPPIITKSEKFNDMDMDFKKKDTINHRRNSNPSKSVKVVKEEKITVKEKKNSSVRRFVVSSPGVRLRLNSPRITGRKIQAAGRKSVSSSSSSSSRRSISDSFAIMKSSFDPQRDFRDSMVEMIVENNIRASKDLEELLACYLSLNSDEYHDLIIKVFKQIWFDLTDINLK